MDEQGKQINVLLEKIHHNINMMEEHCAGINDSIGRIGFPKPSKEPKKSPDLIAEKKEPFSITDKLDLLYYESTRALNKIDQINADLISLV